MGREQFLISDYSDYLQKHYLPKNSMWVFVDCKRSHFSCWQHELPPAFLILGTTWPAMFCCFFSGLQFSHTPPLLMRGQLKPGEGPLPFSRIFSPCFSFPFSSLHCGLYPPDLSRFRGPYPQLSRQTDLAWALPACTPGRNAAIQAGLGPSQWLSHSFSASPDSWWMKIIVGYILCYIFSCFRCKDRSDSCYSILAEKRPNLNL